ncbi:hypothetical protein GCM10009569_35290 [Arthrobacter russicus]|uniref:F5/8 type C domain-containing protein n=1 Tax=Arthrobacter russicus TaxID=172040 RepID=A0ABU1J919_9MICC|nr:hypothetical protein [Arthrobacter russicus]
MADVRCWQAYPDSTGFEDVARQISGDTAYLKVGVSVASVTGSGAQSVMVVQWSDDGTTWTETEPLATITAPPGTVKKFEVKAPYWRIKGVTTGTDAVVTSSAWAIY